MGLKYAHTCSDINGSIEDLKSNIESVIDDILNECCPLLDGEQKNEFMKGYVDCIYTDFEKSFESVRETNISMRKEADSQIENLEERLSELEKEAESELGTLMERISELESEL